MGGAWGGGERGQPGSSNRCTGARDDSGETLAGYQLRRWSNTYSGTGAGASSRRGTGSVTGSHSGGATRAGHFGRGGGLTQARQQREGRARNSVAAAPGRHSRDRRRGRTSAAPERAPVAAPQRGLLVSAHQPRRNGLTRPRRRRTPRRLRSSGSGQQTQDCPDAHARRQAPALPSGARDWRALVARPDPNNRAILRTVLEIELRRRTLA
jgi:hypothetical protein